jgi:hypothetical protein
MNMMMNCLRCDNQWEPRIDGRPKNCPQCKSPLWDRARVGVAAMERAHGQVAKAKRNGVLKVQPCSVCGSEEKIQAHHEDYDNPLDVTWYCPTHHRERHAELGDSLVDMRDNDGKATSVSLRLPLEVLERARAIAKAERRAISRVLVLAIEIGLRRWKQGVRDNGSADGSEAELGGLGRSGGDAGLAGSSALGGDEVGGVAGVGAGVGEGGVDTHGPSGSDVSGISGVDLRADDEGLTDRMPEAVQQPMVPAKRLPDGPDGEHRYDRSNQPPLLDSSISTSPIFERAKPDMAALRAIAAGDRQALSSASRLSARSEPPESDSEGSPAPLCSHLEWVDGDQYRCRLTAGHKGKCARGERV